jgi:hypothetical protein
MKNKLHLYQYCVIDEEGQVHQGMSTAESRAEMIEDISGNFGECRFIHVHPIAGLVPVLSYGQWKGQVMTQADAHAAGRA